ncbi:MAG: DUF4091 domain-containing protein [Armatimonadota bacterium]|nr:DUF4091 domain-containing protein [Armatimonadota bacterium]
MHRITIILAGLTLAAAACMASEPLDVLIIDSFERQDALAAWELRETMAGETVTEHATDGERAVRLDYPRYVEGRQQWPAAILHTDSGLLPESWAGWDMLLFDVHVLAEQAPVLKIQIDTSEGHYQKPQTLPPRQTTTFEVDLRQAEARTNLREVRRLHLYMTRPPQPATLFVDNVRLVSYPIEAGDLTFADDPFHSGHVQVTGELGRDARWRIGVVREAERVVWLTEGMGDDIDWQWEGTDRRGRDVPPGEYRVIVRIADPRRPAAPQTIAELGRTEVIAADQRRDLLLWEEPTTKKVMLFSRPEEGTPVADERTLSPTSSALPRPLHIDMARNEVEGTQLVVLAREQTRLQLDMTNLQREDTHEPFAGEVELFQVGYAKTEAPPQYAVDYVGWWPDLLIPVEQIPGGEMTAEPYECMPVWINVRSRRQTRPGTYWGFVHLHRAGSDTPLTMPLEVVVHDVALPDSTTIRTGFALYEGMIENTYGDDFSEDLLFQFRRFMADHRINPSDIYRRELHDIEMLKYFDERDQLNAFCVRYLRRSEDGQGWGEEQLQALAEELDPFVARLREEGLAEKGYFYGWDERGPQYYPEMARVGRFIKQRYPEIPFVTTAKDHTFGLESGLDGLVDVWVPLTPRYDRELAEAARQRGTHVWWYICIGPHHPYANWFIEYPAIEPRLLWWMTWDYGAEGFLYYTMSRWPNAERPMSIAGGNKTDWDPDSYKGANGDGCLIAAGPEGPISTIRVENIRDGIEDHELLTILTEKRGDGGALGHLICDKVITDLTDFTHDTEHFAEVRRRLLSECAR